MRKNVKQKLIYRGITVKQKDDVICYVCCEVVLCR